MLQTKRAFPFLFALVAMTLSLPQAGASQICEATPERHALHFSSQISAEDTATSKPLELFTGQKFVQPFGNGWSFALLPHKYGWTIHVFDNQEQAQALDLSLVTPPHGGTPNPRELFGWHFRNAANTGPNTGDVNAPQHLRSFFFSPTLAETGGYKPSSDPAELRLSEPSTDDGTGWLRVIDYKLTDPKPGEKASMTYLRFEVCLTWPKQQKDLADSTADDPSVLPEEVEIFGSCGLDLTLYELDPAFKPLTLGGDFDGDDSLDEVVQIRRLSDGKRGLALCRAGTWIHILGMDNATIGDALTPDYFDQLESWRLVGKDHGNFGYEGEPRWPESDGDILVLERIEKEMILLYWRGKRLYSQQVYRYVEP